MKNYTKPTRAQTQNQNKMFLASTFVNGFVNCAFGKDKITMDAVEDNGKCRWDGNPPEGWPKDVGFKNLNYLPKVDLIK